MIILNSIAAILLGLIIFICYGLSCSSESYSLGFNASLFSITVVVGMCCNISRFFYLGLMFLLIFNVYFFLKKRLTDEKYLVRVRTTVNSQDKVINLMRQVFRGNASLLDNKSANGSCELTYLVPGRMIKRRINGQHFSEELYEIDSVSLVSITSQENKGKDCRND